ncbi:hypothetical protein ElyMa_000394400 [Elysia marginata]|uniref:Uncharacterized protein n=1 Tax=Elysia marginata TaxID=1093978 RepID=A0AAV4FID5_9GAST|nr:hypothetical protein ElyMa_000394400 [Elysia marginata]
MLARHSCSPVVLAKSVVRVTSITVPYSFSVRLAWSGSPAFYSNMNNEGQTSSENSTIESNDKILRPHNKLRNIYDLRTLLVIAAEGCLKLPHDLKTFTEGDPKVNVLYTSKLPLMNYDKHPPVEAIALVCKVYCQDR